jgi:hypothetical protein
MNLGQITEECLRADRSRVPERAASKGVLVRLAPWL